MCWKQKITIRNIIHGPQTLAESISCPCLNRLLACLDEQSQEGAASCPNASRGPSQRRPLSRNHFFCLRNYYESQDLRSKQFLIQNSWSLMDIYHLAAVQISFFGGNPRLEGGTVLSPLERWGVGCVARVGAQADMPAGNSEPPH